MRSSIGPLLLAAALGCDKTEEPIRCFVGDPLQPVEMELIFRDTAGQIQPLVEDAQVPLILPPQGGKVMFIGVRAKNLDGCPITISTALRDDCSQQVIALERRPITLEETAEGWLQPLQPAEISNYSNLPACPRANLDRDIHGERYRLTVRIEDKDGRTAERDINIVPTCAEPEYEDRCLCECDADYILGEECIPDRDAGTSTVCPGE